MDCLFDDEMAALLQSKGVKLPASSYVPKLDLEKQVIKRSELAPPFVHTVSPYVQDVVAEDFQHTLPQSRLLKEEAHSLSNLSGFVYECLKPSHAPGSRFKYFSGDATLTVQTAAGELLKVRNCSWPVVDSLLHMNMQAKKLQNASYLVVGVNYRARPLTEDVLNQILKYAEADEAFCKEMRDRLQCNSYRVLDRNYLAQELHECGKLDRVNGLTRFFMIGITIKLADAYERRKMAGESSPDVILLIWYIATVRREAVKLCFPHLFRNDDLEIKLPELSLNGYHFLASYLRTQGVCLESLDSITEQAINYYQTCIRGAWCKKGHTMLPEPLSYRTASGGLKYMDVSREVVDRLVGPPFYALVRYSSSSTYTVIQNEIDALRSHIGRQQRNNDNHRNYRYDGPAYFTADSYQNASTIRDCLKKLLSQKGELAPAVSRDQFLASVREEMQEHGMTLHTAQQLALECAFQKRLLCVTGAGGTGKSSVFIRYYKRLRDEVYKQRTLSSYGGDLILCECTLCMSEIHAALSPSDARVCLTHALQLLSRSLQENELQTAVEGLKVGKKIKKVLQELLPLAARNIKTKGAIRHLLIVAATATAATNLHTVTDGMGETMDMVIKRARYAPTTIYTESIQTLLIEEASCCDDARFANLLTCLPNLKQIIFVFDNNQIGPVKAGFLSKDMHDLLQPRNAVVRFTENYRALGEKDCTEKQGAHALLTMYEAILERKTELLSKCCTILPESITSSMKSIREYGLLSRKESVLLAHCTQSNELEVTSRLYAALRSQGVTAQVLAFTRRTCAALNEACFTAVHGGVYKKGVYKLGQRVVFTKNYYPPQKLEDHQKKCKEQHRKRQQRKKSRASSYFMYGSGKTTTERLPSKERAMDPHRGSNRVCNGEVWQIDQIEPRSADYRDRYLNDQGEPVQCLWTSEVRDVDMTRLVTQQDGVTKWCYVEDVGAENIKPGDVLTGHKGQGKQYPVVVVHLGDTSSPHMTLNVNYTMVSRCRSFVILVVNLKKHNLPYGELERALREAGRVYCFSGLYRLLQELDFSQNDAV